MDRIRSEACLIFILLIISISSFAKDDTKVNIISWWGYISKEDKIDIKKFCKADISVDEYFSSSEFLRRWDNKSNQYDITIHSNTIYNSVKNRLPKTHKVISVEYKYHPVIQRKLPYLELKSNTRLLTLGFTGFLWNKESFKISPKQSLKEMLDLANNKVVIILDDPMEGMQILDSLNYFKLKDSSQNGANKAKVIISNDMEHIVGSKEFAFAYHWSGGAIQHIRKNPSKLDFLIHPNLSQITADLVSLNTNSAASLCVFNYLSSEAFTSKIQAETAYFSPYGPSSSNKDTEFKKIYEKYFLELDNYQWLKKPKEDDFKIVDKKWKVLKSELSSI